MVGGRVATSWKDRQAVPRTMVQSPGPQHQEGRMESGGRSNRLRGSGIHTNDKYSDSLHLHANCVVLFARGLRWRKNTFSHCHRHAVFSKQAYMGNRWCEIAKLLPGRTENAVKNRFNSSARKKWLDQNPGGASVLTPDLLNKVWCVYFVSSSGRRRIIFPQKCSLGAVEWRASCVCWRWYGSD